MRKTLKVWKWWWWRRRFQTRRNQFLMIVASLILCFLGPLNKLKIKTFSRTRFAFALIKHSLSSFGFSSLLLSHLLLIIYCINEEIDAYKRRNAFYYYNLTHIVQFSFVGLIISGPSPFQFSLCLQSFFIGFSFSST